MGSPGRQSAAGRACERRSELWTVRETILLLAVHVRLVSDRKRKCGNGSADLKTLTKRSWAAAWGVLGCWLLVCDGDAWAQAQPAPAAPSSAQAAPAGDAAEKHYEAGVGYAKAVKWAEAREEFRQAYEASPKLKSLAGLIKAEIAIGLKAKAATHLVAMLRRRSELDPNTLAEAEAKLAELRTQIGAATITVNAEGAEVVVDGEVVGRSPIADEVFVEAGPRKFQARKAGLTAEQSVDVAPGSKPAVALTMTEAPGPRPGPRKEEGGGSNTKLIYAGAIVAGGLAVVALGTFIGAEALYGPAEEKLNRPVCDEKCKEDFNSLTSTQQALGYTALITFIGAGVVGGATFACWMSGKKSDEVEKGPQGAVVVMPGGGGVFVSGHW